MDATAISTVNVGNYGIWIEWGDNEGTSGYETDIIEGANVVAAFATQLSGEVFYTTT